MELQKILDVISQREGKKIEYGDLTREEKEKIDVWYSMLNISHNPEDKIKAIKEIIDSELNKAVNELGGYDITIEKRLYNTAYYRILKMIKLCIEAEKSTIQQAKDEIALIYGHIL